MNGFWIMLSIVQGIALIAMLLALPALYRREARRKEAGV